MDPLEWLARIADHIPDPGRHRTLFYSFYSSRARGARAKEKALLEGVSAESPKKRCCAPSWARLISKVYHADPLTCRQCGGKLKIVAAKPAGGSGLELTQIRQAPPTGSAAIQDLTPTDLGALPAQTPLAQSARTRARGPNHGLPTAPAGQGQR